MGAALAAFVVFGVRGIVSVRSRRTDGGGPFGSTDSFLIQTLGVHDGSRQILDAISGMPPVDPLVIIAPGNSDFATILPPDMAVASITWPHEVYLVRVGDGAELRERLGDLRDEHFSTALLYGFAPPPADSRVRRIGLLTVLQIPK